MPPPNHDIVAVAAVAFGIAAAILIVGGAILLRGQRNRHRYLLMKIALERGVTPLREGPPMWVISRRQGLSTLTFGIGLLIVGLLLHGAAERVAMPTMATSTMAMPGNASSTQPTAALQPEGPPPDMDRGPNGMNDNPLPPDGRMGPDDQRGPRFGPGDRRGPEEMRRHDFRMPTPNPALEAWHRAQGEKSLGTICAAIGFILLLLGFVRIVFSGVERRHTPMPITPPYPTAAYPQNPGNPPNQGHPPTPPTAPPSQPPGM